MKYKLLSTGKLVACDGSRHHFEPLGIQPTTALCWCHQADDEQLARWQPTPEAARTHAEALTC